MARYFFDLADGDNDIDAIGDEFSDDDAAIREAVRYLGSLVRDRPEILLSGHEFTVSVRSGDAPPIAKVVAQLTIDQS